MKKTDTGICKDNVSINYSDYPNLSKEDIEKTVLNYINYKHKVDSENRRTKNSAKRKKYIYMVCTNDEYELPIAVGDSTTEVANILRKPRRYVTEMFARNHSCFHKIPITEEEYKEIFIE